MSKQVRLRDWYAGQALPAVLASAIQVPEYFAGADDLNQQVAETAWAVADAMMAARGQGQ